MKLFRVLRLGRVKLNSSFLFFLFLFPFAKLPLQQSGLEPKSATLIKIIPFRLHGVLPLSGMVVISLSPGRTHGNGKGNKLGG